MKKSMGLFAASFILSTISFSMLRAEDTSNGACSADTAKFCSAPPKVETPTQDCLSQHAAELSTECKTKRNSHHPKARTKKHAMDAQKSESPGVPAAGLTSAP